jgi:alanine racemase
MASHSDTELRPAPAATAARRPNALVVDLDAITSNVVRVRELVGPGTTVFGAVKADGYGFGLPEVAEAMIAGGADALSMADPADAIRIREAGIDVPILLYGGVLPEPPIARVLDEYALTCTIGDLAAARAWSAASERTLRAFLKVDVGLERLGVAAEAAGELARGVAALPGIRIEGVYTHLHGGHAPGYLSWQLDRFERALEAISSVGVDAPVRLAESSVTLGLERRPRLNAVDPGHLLYGFVPVGRAGPPAGLRPAFVALTTRVLQVKEVERPGFPDAAPVPLREGMRIAVLPLGRADGLRTLNLGEVLVRGRRAPIVGRLSLEHTRVDVTEIPECAAGDEVVVIGRQGGEEIGFEDVAARHELDGVGLTLEVRPSVPRAYRRNDVDLATAFGV